MKTKLFLVCMIAGMLCCPAAWAWDTTPDPETGLYDKWYDRPTHFPEWEQPNTWANVMYLFCEVRKGSVEGERVESYEIAVYDQNDALRNCGRSLALQDHYCLLTIPGEDAVDVFHFQVLCGDFVNPTIVDIADTEIAFETNKSIGNAPNDPFVFVVPIGTPTGMEQITNDENRMTHKTLRDGMIVIQREGRTYSADGREL